MSRARSGRKPAHALEDSPGFTRQIDPQLVEAIAQRTAAIVLEALAGGNTPAAGRELVDAATLARILGVSRDSIYEHADELGAVRIGDGPRARLRFDVERATAAHTRVVAAATPATRRRQPKGSSTVALLPVKEQPRRRAA